MKKRILGLAAAVIVIALLFGVAPGGRSTFKSSASTEGVSFDHTIQVSGTGVINITPDTAIINFGIRVQKKTAANAMDSLSEIANRVVSALKNFGIKEEDIKTKSIRLTPVYQWEKDTRKNIVVGYAATENFEVKSSLKDAGRIISLATENGANRVYGIRFDSSKKDELKNKAITEAMNDARAKAEAALKGTNYKIVGIKTISIQSGYITPIYRTILPDEIAKGSSSSVPVESGSMSVKATIQVVFIFD